MEGSILFLGAATVLIRLGGFTLLTDPHFRDAALSIEQLPPLDLCLLSQLDEDHCDRVAEARLPRELPIITTPQAARRLAKKGFVDLQPLRPWQGREFVRGALSLAVTAMPAQLGFSLLKPRVMDVMLDFAANGHRVFRLYFSGYLHRAPAELERRHPDIDLALLRVGAGFQAWVCAQNRVRQFARGEEHRFFVGPSAPFFEPAPLG
jgi:L-ascorbate metabolism protein UlaG (beta-lactamase superfamily)